MQTNPITPIPPFAGMILFGAPIPIARMSDKTALRVLGSPTVERDKRGLPNSCSAAGPANFHEDKNGPIDQ